MRSNEWIFGLVLMTIGVIFLLQQAGLPLLVGNWWALFILIPAVAAFSAAWAAYRQAGRLTAQVIGLFTGGLVPLTIALIFLLNFDFGAAWPVILLVLGAGILLRSAAPESSEQPTHMPS